MKLPGPIVFPPGVESEDVPFEHPLKQANGVIAVLQDQPILRRISANYREAEQPWSRRTSPDNLPDCRSHP